MSPNFITNFLIIHGVSNVSTICDVTKFQKKNLFICGMTKFEKNISVTWNHFNFGQFFSLLLMRQSFLTNISISTICDVTQFSNNFLIICSMPKFSNKHFNNLLCQKVFEQISLLFKVRQGFRTNVSKNLRCEKLSNSFLTNGQKVHHVTKFSNKYFDHS